VEREARRLSALAGSRQENDPLLVEGGGGGGWFNHPWPLLIK